MKKALATALVTFQLGLSKVSAQGFFGGGEGANRPDVADDRNLREAAVFYINYFLGFLGLVAVAMIIYAGILMVTAQGEEEQLNKGKKIITWAAIGLVIIMLSFAIVRVVIGAGSGA